MPRYSLYRSPWWSTTSPGDSSTPASSDPSITTSAPAASAFGMSPENWMPPSAMSVTPCRFAATAQSWMAVTCGTPTPATTRVVQIEPGPTPTFTPSAPAATIASTASPVATLPPMTSTSRLPLICFTMSSTPWLWPWAVSTTSRSTPAATSASARSRASGPTPTAAATRRRPRSSWVASGYSVCFLMSLTVIRPRRAPASSTIGSFSMRCCQRMSLACSRVVPSGAVTSGAFFITRSIGWSWSSTKRRSRLVRMPTSLPSPSTIGTPLIL